MLKLILVVLCSLNATASYADIIDSDISDAHNEEGLEDHLYNNDDGDPIEGEWEDEAEDTPDSDALHLDQNILNHDNDDIEEDEYVDIIDDSDDEHDNDDMTKDEDFNVTEELNDKENGQYE